MAPFRPTNLNKRAYPGNAGVVGPDTRATVGYTTTTCCTCNCTLCGAANISWTLGCRNQPASYPCCACCCCCVCTVCTRAIPSGRYKSSEQYEARTRRDAWSASSCSNAAAIGFCGTPGTLTGCTVDCKGFYVVQYGSRILLAPSCTQQAVAPCVCCGPVTLANQCMGTCGWYIGDESTVNAAHGNRGYWDHVTVDQHRDDYYTTTSHSGTQWRVVYVKNSPPYATWQPGAHAAQGNYHIWGRSVRAV